MTELYTNYTDNQVSISLPTTVPYVDLAFSVNGVPFLINSQSAVRLNPTSPGKFKFSVPFSALRSEGELVATWGFLESNLNQSIRQVYDIVTLVYPIDKIMTEYGVDSDKAEVLELMARGIIENYTGQSFGYYEGPVSIAGSGGAKAILPRRLISLDSVSPVLSRSYPISGSGYFLNSSKPFVNNEPYVITGKWGYHHVPSAVQAAAGIIIKGLIDDEPNYRDRYLDAVRSADWRIEYNSRAFDGTGSVLADQLLSPYVITRLVVI